MPSANITERSRRRMTQRNISNYNNAFLDLPPDTSAGPPPNGNTIHPYPDKNIFLLGDWHWNYGIQKSQESFSDLLSIIGSPNFRRMSGIPGGRELMLSWRQMSVIPNLWWNIGKLNGWTKMSDGSEAQSEYRLNHCRREVLHAQWEILVDQEFLEAYKHGAWYCN